MGSHQGPLEPIEPLLLREGAEGLLSSGRGL